ncbi:MAG TPA: YjbF family lipoprotein [Rhizomicrobium sp.]|nr:YjbF family lipoprotein [Rhizomicrobium sp.]
MSFHHKQIAAAALPLLALVAGCSSEQRGDWTEVYGIFQRAFSDNAVTYQQAAQIPFASIGVRVGGGSEGILVLASSNADQQLWTAASHVVLLLRAGRIVKTAGLEHNLNDMRLVRGGTGQPESVWEADFGDLHAYSVLIRCHAVSRGPGSINNFGTPVATVQVDEECRSDQLDWSFTNSYWIAPQSGLIWRSVQYVSPKLDPLTIRVLRPPG